MTAHDKSAWRRRQLRVRRNLPESLRARHAAAIQNRLRLLPQVVAARRIFCYVSCRSEVCTHELLEDWLREGRSVCVPLIREHGMLARKIDSLAQLQPNRYGIQEPASGPEFDETIELSITPGLGFSAAGTRLGYGRGYYDRWFAHHPEHPRVALAFEVQLCKELPAREHDLPVHWIVTEERAIRTGAPFPGTP